MKRISMSICEYNALWINFDVYAWLDYAQTHHLLLWNNHADDDDGEYADADGEDDDTAGGKMMKFSHDIYKSTMNCHTWNCSKQVAASLYTQVMLVMMMTMMMAINLMDGDDDDKQIAWGMMMQGSAMCFHCDCPWHG